MTRLLLCLLVALLGLDNVSAQPTIRLGLRAGVNVANTTVASSSTGGNSGIAYSADKSAIYAWQTGPVLEIDFKRIALQPALLISQKGEVFESTVTTSGNASTVKTISTNTSRYNWLELPVNLVYKVKRIQFFAGPYWAMAIGGHLRGGYVSESSTGSTFSQSFDGKIKYGDGTSHSRYDAGLNLGIGYRKGPLQAQVSYGLGMRNLTQTVNYYDSVGHNFDDDAAYNRTVQLTATYFFEL